MAFFLRDCTIGIAHIDDDVIIAGRGIQEWLQPPSLRLTPRYGLRKNVTPIVSNEVLQGEGSSSQPLERPLSQYLIGAALEDALAKEPDEIEVHWPFRDIHTPTSSLGESSNLEKAGNKSTKVDWRGREAILHHLFFREWSLQPQNNTTALLLLPPPQPPLLSPSTLEAYSQMSFESLNCPAFHVLPSSIAAIFGVGLPAGLNVHIGRHATDIIPVIDSLVRPEAHIRVEAGTSDCVTYLAEILSKDQAIRQSVEALSKDIFGEDVHKVDLLMEELAEVILREEKPRILVPLANGQTVPVGNEDTQEGEEGVFDVAKELTRTDASKAIQQLKEARSKKSATAQAVADKQATNKAKQAAAQAAADLAADIQQFTLRGREIPVGPIRHRACEPLYRPFDGLPYGNGRTVQEGMASAVNALDIRERQNVWDGVVFTGELAKVPSLSFAIVSWLNVFLASDPDRGIDGRPSSVRILKLPEYFTNFRGHGTDLAPFLGASLAGKLIFSDNNKHCVTKTDYNNHGPAAIHLSGAME